MEEGIGTEGKKSAPELPLKIKRMLFFLLIFLFVIYSFAVDTAGTSRDKGEDVLTADAREGKLLFQKYNCTACHQLYGLGGYMGPDLTNVMSAPGKGTEYVNSFLLHGTGRMPDFHLDENERRKLIAFLNYTSRTGQSPPVRATVNADGTITLPDEK